MGRWLVIILLLLVGLTHWYANRGLAAGDPRQSTGSDGVVMLSATWCGYCDRLRQDLDRSGLSYRELDIERDPEGVAAWKAINGRGVPLTVVGQTLVPGYNPSEVLRRARAAGHSLSN